MRPTILLYDIDGTLISSSGAGRRAMETAFFARFGRRGLLDFPFDGMTDQAIVRAGLARAGEEGEAAMETTLAAYLVALEAEAARSPDFRVHDGIADSLALTIGRPGFAVGLGTGNVRAGAVIKLGRVGLHDRFPFGGFGDDHLERPALLRIGAERGAALLGAPLPDCRVVVIGDTPKDITAAQAIGADCIAVGTGNFRPDDLAAYRPTWVFASLAAPGAEEALLGTA